MIECACSCDYDGDGIFVFGDGYTARAYHHCCECGAIIWPWEAHRIGRWWDCEGCESGDSNCNYEDCPKDLEPTSKYHCCAACANVCKQLLCNCWWVGRVWETVADHNDMLVIECLGPSGGSEK